MLCVICALIVQSILPYWGVAPAGDNAAIVYKLMKGRSRCGLFFFLCIPQLYLWGSPFWGWDFCVCGRFFNPTIAVVTFHLNGRCMLGVFLLPEFTYLGHLMSGSYDSMQWNACVHRLDLSLYSHPKEFWGNGLDLVLTPRGKSPLPEKKILLRGWWNPRSTLHAAELRARHTSKELFRPQCGVKRRLPVCPKPRGRVDGLMGRPRQDESVSSTLLVPDQHLPAQAPSLGGPLVIVSAVCHLSLVSPFTSSLASPFFLPWRAHYRAAFTDIH